MWIRTFEGIFSQLIDVHRFGIKADPLEGGYEIIAEDIFDLDSLKRPLPSDYCFGCVLGTYSSLEEALYIFNEIQRAVASGQMLYVMPEAGPLGKSHV